MLNFMKPGVHFLHIFQASEKLSNKLEERLIFSNKHPKRKWIGVCTSQVLLLLLLFDLLLVTKNSRLC